MKFPNIQITCWNDMEKIGFSALTGERDNTMTHRLLVDMSLTGAMILRELMDLPYGPAGSMPFNSNWNRMVGENAAIYSAMIPADWWPQLAVFGLLKLGSLFVYNNESMVWNDDGESWQQVDIHWSLAEAKAMKLEGGRDHPQFYQTMRESVPDYIRKVNRWKGLSEGQTINQVHAMSQRP